MPAIVGGADCRIVRFYRVLAPARGWLEAGRMLPRKQRHTAKRAHDRLRAETDYDGEYTTTLRYVRRWRETNRRVPTRRARPGAQGRANRLRLFVFNKKLMIGGCGCFLGDGHAALLGFHGICTEPILTTPAAPTHCRMPACLACTITLSFSQASTQAAILR